MYTLLMMLLVLFSMFPIYAIGYGFYRYKNNIKPEHKDPLDPWWD